MPLQKAAERRGNVHARALPSILHKSRVQERRGRVHAGSRVFEIGGLKRLRLDEPGIRLEQRPIGPLGFDERRLIIKARRG